MKQFKILLLGKNGQVGRCLRRSLSNISCEILACGREQGNFENYAQLQQLIQTYQPDIIINAAAYTDVAQAELEPQLAYQINAEAVAQLAQATKQLSPHAWLIHYSSDYVFDGKKIGRYLETDPTNPLNVYGHSKLNGDKAIAAANCNHLILRSTWIYSHFGKNFPLAILDRALKCSELTVVSDSFGVPTNAQLIADVTALLLEKIMTKQLTPADSGIYNITPQGETTWFEFAQTIVDQANKLGLKLKIQPHNIRPVTNEQYSNKLQRPLNSCLNLQKISQILNATLPHWHDEFCAWLHALPQLHNMKVKDLV